MFVDIFEEVIDIDIAFVAFAIVGIERKTNHRGHLSLIVR